MSVVMTFRIHRSINWQYYFTVTAGNGQVLATSETYTSKSAAQNAIHAIKTAAASAQVLDLAA